MSGGKVFEKCGVLVSISQTPLSQPMLKELAKDHPAVAKYLKVLYPGFFLCCCCCCCQCIALPRLNRFPLSRVFVFFLTERSWLVAMAMVPLATTSCGAR